MPVRRLSSAGVIDVGCPFNFRVWLASERNGPDPQKTAIADADVITPVQRPAKRQKTSHDVNLSPRTRQDAWNIRFSYNADRTSIGLVKEKTAIVPAAYAELE